MNPTPSPSTPFPRGWVWLGVGLALIGLILFIANTPPGLLDKLDYVGAAVCHRIPSHSFFVDGRQLPLCQRCSGTFPGALTGLILQWGVWRRRRAQQFPRLPLLLVFLVFACAWGLDGFNSYTTFFTGGPQGILGYAPQPWLRLLTGVLMGAGMSVLLVPAFNLACWSDGLEEPTLRSWSELGIMVGAELALAALIYSLEPWLLYPIAIYTTLGVVTMFVMLGAMLFVMILNRESTLGSWRAAWLPLAWGIVFALALVGGIAFARVAWLGGPLGIPGLE